MRELIEKNQKVTIIPSDFKYANKGIVTEVSQDGFELKLDYSTEGILKNNYCEFYTDTKYGTLHFDSYAKDINSDNNTLIIANPAKHKFLQRRQFTRIKYIHDLTLIGSSQEYNIHTLDVSAGGIKFSTRDNIDIAGKYNVTLPLTEKLSLNCTYCPIRIERLDDGTYIHSGRFEFMQNHDRMVMIQYCTKRSIEIKNK